MAVVNHQQNENKLLADCGLVLLAMFHKQSIDTNEIFDGMLDGMMWL
jgi:hypothetical protein